MSGFNCLSVPVHGKLLVYLLSGSVDTQPRWLFLTLQFEMNRTPATVIVKENLTGDGVAPEQAKALNEVKGKVSAQNASIRFGNQGQEGQQGKC